MAFGFGGIYDDDEAARIAEASTMKQIDPATGEITSKPKALPPYSDEAFTKNLGVWQGLIETGKKTADQIIAMVSSKATLTEDQIYMIRAAEALDSNTIDMEQTA
jgi:hypothetical protein